MSNGLDILLVIIFILSMIIFVLSFIAYNNRNDYHSGKSPLHSLDPLWIFHEEYYNDYGKSVCRLARKIAFLTVAVLAIYLFLKII